MMVPAFINLKSAWSMAARVPADKKLTLENTTPCGKGLAVWCWPWVTYQVAEEILACRPVQSARQKLAEGYIALG
jgi:hypothetical protein